MPDRPLIEVFFYPVFTLKPRSEVDPTPCLQVVACFGIPCKSPDEGFQPLAKIVWLAALRAFLGNPSSWGPDYEVSLETLGAEYPEHGWGAFTLDDSWIANQPGLREALRSSKTLARANSPNPLDFDHLEQLMRVNFRVHLKCYVAAEPIVTVFFPPIPGLRLVAPQEGVNFEFSSEAERGSEFEEALDTVLESLHVRPSNETVPSPSGARRDPVSFATLVFEQYFDRLCSVTNEFYYRELRKLLEQQGQVSLPLRELLAAGDVGELAGQMSSDFYSGIRLPEQFTGGQPLPTGDFKGLYDWCGQQFSLTNYDPRHAHNAYEIAIRASTTGAPPDWVSIEPDGSPHAPITREIDGIEAEALLAATLPIALDSCEPLHPLERQPRRFSLSHPQPWTQANSAVSAIWPLGQPLQKEITDLARELAPLDPNQLGYDLIETRFFADEASASGPAQPDDDQEYALLRWAMVIPLMVRQVLPASSNDAALNPIEHLYELVGMAQSNRFLIDRLLQDPSSAGLSEVFLAYPNAGGGFISDDLDLSSDACQCVMLRTNLTTESAPLVGFARPRTDSDVASIGEPLSFLRLVQHACIVNSGGYYLHYEPTEGSPDPMKALFDDPDHNERGVLIQLIVPFEPVATSHEPRPFYNAVVGPTQNAQGENTPFLFAKLSRGVPRIDRSVDFFPVTRYDVRMAPGCVGFSASRFRVPDVQPSDPQSDQTAHYLDNLFCRLSYSVSPPGMAGFRSFPLTLPVVAMEPNGSRTVSNRWTWQHTLQVLEAPFDNPYLGIGSHVDVRFGFRDIFGNEFPATGLATQVSLPIRYYDALIGCAEWPGLRTEFDIDAQVATPELYLKLRANPFANLSGNAEQQKLLRESIRLRYTTIQTQLSDPRVRAAVRLDMGTGISVNQTILDDLKSLVSEILGMDPDATPVEAERRIILGRPDFSRAADFFPLAVKIEIKRDGSDDLFWKVQDPWNAQPHVFEPCRQITSPAGRPGATDALGSNADPGLRRFAIGFESLYAAEALKIATGPDEFGEDSLWIVRAEHLKPRQIRRVPATSSGVELFFSPRPLSTDLIFQEVDEVPVEAPGSEESTVLFSGVDLDVKAREFLVAVEQFFDTATVAGILRLKDSGNAPIGRTHYQTVLSAKRRLANFIPTQLVEVLLQDSPPLPDCSQETAVAAFRQRVLTTLNAAYDTDLVVPFVVEAPAAMSSNAVGDGLTLFGRLKDKDPIGVTEGLNYSNDKIRYHSNLTANPPRLNLIVDQASTIRSAPNPRKLEFEWSHIEFNIPLQQGPSDCSTNVDYTESTWLSFVVPVQVPVNENIEFGLPIPRREHPLPPRISAQRAHHARTPSDVRSARLWNYETAYEISMEFQDELEFSVDLNVDPSTFQFTRSTDALFTALMRFHAAFPHPTNTFEKLRTASDPERIALLEHFAFRVDAVATAWLSSFVARPASNAEHRTLWYLIRESDDGITGRRLCDVSRLEVDREFPAAIGPGPGSPQVDPANDLTHRYEFDDQEFTPGWRNRLLSIPNVNIVRYETARCRAKMFRNRTLEVKSGISSRFFPVAAPYVYQTTESHAPNPLVPRIDVAKSLPVSPPGAFQSLGSHLRGLVEDLFEGVPTEASPRPRRLRLEVRYAFAARAIADPASSPTSWKQDILVPSPQRLLPPYDVMIDDIDPLIETLIDSLARWRTEFDPSGGGSLIFDLLLYAALSQGDQDKPLLRLTSLQLPLRQITTWTV